MRLEVSQMNQDEGGKRRVDAYACAPSLNAMKGSKDHSFSEAGSEPGSAPIQVSTSGPLYDSLASHPSTPKSPRAHLNKLLSIPRMMEIHNTHERIECRHVFNLSFYLLNRRGVNNARREGEAMKSPGSRVLVMRWAMLAVTKGNGPSALWD